jgi:hypothetical protein
MNAATPGDEFVFVARANNQSEAEFLENLLRAEGVPALIRRAAGFDVPDFLAAGPREVLVPASLEGVARDVLLQNQPEEEDG